ncbi:glycosyltransferase family 2 protein [Acinetobacter sp. F9]|uniref:glycosyltransferase family 2 protein n=1 Tax=Acinetobacter sp. F9 TaxID=2853158 RepID=UPI001C45DFEF|nr:glycosyltransferase family 2 protein [Acinetobacter sp. F9]
MHKNPLLSIIIPTYNRPEFLPRAVQSALNAAPNGDVEVIVVPNGGDESWRESLFNLMNDSRLVVSPIGKGHANAARNHGLQLATGKYVRFLDDDDFFYSAVAVKQLEKLIELDADISYGQITKTDEVGKILEIAKQLDTDDFIEAAISPGNSTATCALVIKRSITENCVWDENINKNQDVYWAWELCKKHELKSFKFKQSVAAWVQHSKGIRVSKGHHKGLVAKTRVEYLLALHNKLKDRNRLTTSRKKAIAENLWSCIHDGMMFQPLFWLRIGQFAYTLDHKSRPNITLYKNTFIRRINPILIEMALIPWRWFRILLGKKYTT